MIRCSEYGYRVRRSLSIRISIPSLVANRRTINIGIIAFSVSDELACVAAADPRIRDRVAFLGFLGGYFDVTSLLRTVGMRSQDVNGQMQPWHPITTTLYVLAYSMSSQLTPSEQKLLLKAFPLTKFAPPLTRQQQAQLSPSAAAFYHLE